MERHAAGGLSSSAIWLSTPARIARPVGRVTRLLKSEVTERRCTGMRRKKACEPGAGSTRSGVGDGDPIHAVAAHQLANHVHTFGHLAEHRVHPVEVTRVGAA